MSDLFQVTNKINKIDVDIDKLIKLCKDYDLYPNYITFDYTNEKYGVIDVVFKKQYTDDELLNLITILNMQSEVKYTKIFNFPSSGGCLITRVRIRFDGIIEDKKTIYL